MEFPRVDSDDGAILFVELDDAECVLTAKNNVVVEFIPEKFRAIGQSRGRNFWRLSLGRLPIARGLPWKRKRNTYQNVTAAIFGPGTCAIGLK